MRLFMSYHHHTGLRQLTVTDEEGVQWLARKFPDTIFFVVEITTELEEDEERTWKCRNCGSLHKRPEEQCPICGYIPGVGAEDEDMGATEEFIRNIVRDELGNFKADNAGYLYQVRIKEKA